jgi:predicted DNA-binding protein (UPF0251 family)
MSRPKRKCCVKYPPTVDGFKPFGLPINTLEPVILLCEEYNSLRLCDYEGLTQEQAAERMSVSRPTFTRIYEKARRAVAQAFVEGRTIVIEGGNYYSENSWYRCSSCQKLVVTQSETDTCDFCQCKKLRKLSSNYFKTETIIKK